MREREGRSSWEYSGINPISGSPIYLLIGRQRKKPRIRDDIPGGNARVKPCEMLRIDPWSIIFGSLPIRFDLFIPPSCFTMQVHGGHFGGSPALCRRNLAQRTAKSRDQWWSNPERADSDSAPHRWDRQHTTAARWQLEFAQSPLSNMGFVCGKGSAMPATQTSARMEKDYDLFERTQGDSLFWHGCVHGLEDARRKLQQLAKSTTNEAP